MKRIYQIEIDENGAIIDPDDIPALRALIGDEEPKQLADERALKQQFQQRFQEKRDELQAKMTERDEFIKTKRDQLNAAHRRAIEKLRDDAKTMRDDLRGQIETLEEEKGTLQSEKSNLEDQVRGLQEQVSRLVALVAELETPEIDTP